MKSGLDEPLFVVFIQASYSNWGRKEDTMSTASPMTRMVMVLREHPFHSLRIMPQTLEKVTLRAWSMHQLKASSTGASVRKPLPRLRPKNWLYHRSPARQQKMILLPQREPLE